MEYIYMIIRYKIVQDFKGICIAVKADEQVFVLRVIIRRFVQKTLIITAFSFGTGQAVCLQNYCRNPPTESASPTVGNSRNSFAVSQPAPSPQPPKNFPNFPFDKPKKSAILKTYGCF